MSTEPQVSPHLVVRIEGVSMPTWVAVIGGAGFFVCCLTLAIVLVLGGLILSDLRTEMVGLRGEIRVLQLYVGDVQDVMIRQGLAQRGDFIRPHRDGGKGKGANDAKP